MANPVPALALYGGINAIINIILAANVSRNRGKANVFLGTGESEPLLRASRAHANNAEYVPLALVLLAAAELSGGGSAVLHAFGGTLTVARLAHAHGMLAGVLPTRILGTVLTWLTVAGLGGYLLFLRFGA